MRTIAVFLAIIAVPAIAGCGNRQSAQQPAQPTVTAPPALAPPPSPAAQPAAKPAKPGEEVTTASGLKYKDAKVGAGQEVVAGDTVKVNYKGWLDNGKVFDSSKKPGREPFGFTVGAGQVIKGWDEGVVGMKVGGVRELTVPANLGYGDQDMDIIPPNSTLHFSVELLEITK